LPDADTIYPNSTPYSPIGIPLYPKRP
jgi:hypothetical protein